MKKILVSAPFDFLPLLKKDISETFDCIFAYEYSRENTIQVLQENEFEGWLVSPCPTYFIDEEIMSYCPTIKIISTPSTGTNHIDVKSATKKGIEIFSLRGTKVISSITASSEFTFNLILSTIRKTPYAFNGVLNGNWRNAEKLYRGRELSSLSIGIIGFGRIGSNVSKYCNAFNMDIFAFDPHANIDRKYVKEAGSLNELVSAVDIVTVCVHLNEQTKGMVNENLFNKMKDGVYLINTSRGAVINEEDLINNLKNGKILAAGLDVLSDELVEGEIKSPLIDYAKTHDNLIITPHMAGLTFDSEEKAQAASFDAIKKNLLQ